MFSDGVQCLWLKRAGVKHSDVGDDRHEGWLMVTMKYSSEKEENDNKLQRRRNRN